MSIISKLADLRSIKFSKVTVLFLLILALALGFLPFALIEPLYFEWGNCPPGMQCLLLPPTQGISPKLLFAIAVATYCIAISTFVLLVTLPIYLFSKNESRSTKAGGLVKSSFGFIVTSGTALLGTLSFADA